MHNFLLKFFAKNRFFFVVYFGNRENFKKFRGRIFVNSNFIRFRDFENFGAAVLDSVGPQAIGRGCQSLKWLTLAFFGVVRPPDLKFFRDRGFGVVGVKKFGF